MYHFELCMCVTDRCQFLLSKIAKCQVHFSYSNIRYSFYRLFYYLGFNSSGPQNCFGRFFLSFFFCLIDVFTLFSVVRSFSIICVIADRIKYAWFQEVEPEPNHVLQRLSLSTQIKHHADMTFFCGFLRKSSFSIDIT